MYNNVLHTLFFLYSKMETSKSWAFCIPIPQNVRYRWNTFKSVSLNSYPWFPLVLFIIWATPMTSPSKLQTGILTREWVVYPVLTSMSRLKRGSCRIQKLIKYRQGHCLQANKRCDRILGNIFNQYRVSKQHYKPKKSFHTKLRFFYKYVF